MSKVENLVSYIRILKTKIEDLNYELDHTSRSSDKYHRVKYRLKQATDKMNVYKSELDYLRNFEKYHNFLLSNEYFLLEDNRYIDRLIRNDDIVAPIKDGLIANSILRCTIIRQSIQQIILNEKSHEQI
jgi:site-specific DNA-adenine methylase